MDSRAAEALAAIRHQPHVRKLLPFAPDSPLWECREDKNLFYEWCESRDLSCPRWVRVADEDLAVMEAGKMGYPCLLKGAAGSGGESVRVTDNEMDLRAAFTELCRKEETILIQKYVDGPVGTTAFLADHGRIVCSEDSMKTIALADGLGPSVVRTFIQDPRLDELTRAVVSAAGYHGISAFDWMKSANGEFYIIDPHFVRCSTQCYTSLIADVDFGKGLFEMLAGNPGIQKTVTPSVHIVQFPQVIELLFAGRFQEISRLKGQSGLQTEFLLWPPGETKLGLHLAMDYVRGLSRVKLGALKRRLLNRPGRS
jgi:hypothetical protein